jgi:hypothetical protein
MTNKPHELKAADLTVGLPVPRIAQALAELAAMPSEARKRIAEKLAPPKKHRSPRRRRSAETLIRETEAAGKVVHAITRAPDGSVPHPCRSGAQHRRTRRRSEAHMTRRRPRSALTLPRYVERKPAKSGWAYFFHVPSWAPKKGCTIESEPLGTDYAAAVQRAETVLLPAFDSWRTGGKTDAEAPTSVAKIGTLDWLFSGFRADRRFTKLDAKTRRLHESGMRMVGNHVLKDGRRLGTAALTSITTAVVDALYEKLLVLKKTDADGKEIERERATTINNAMKTCRRAWNVVSRATPGKVPTVNPFSKMGLKSTSRETPTATFPELQAFRLKAIEMGLPSLATAALIGWEWVQREHDIFGHFDVKHYRPKERPNAVRVVHWKTRAETWIPLFDPESGTALYPELMAELDAIGRERIGGLMLRRDWGERGPWPTWPQSDLMDLTHMSRKVKEVIRAAGLRDELTFTSFSHGGFTEGADSDLTDAEMRAMGRHKSAKVLPRYAKRTMKQVASAARKRRAQREAT